MMKLERIEGWERRLDEVVEGARNLTYQVGQHDCFRFACRAVEALTLVDLYRQWAGYKTKTEVLRLVAANGGDFTSAISNSVFGCRPSPVRTARRGDILEYTVKMQRGSDQHLAVCVGAYAAGLGKDGLMFLPLLDCEHVWRIG
jgi:hypothetical protein